MKSIISDHQQVCISGAGIAGMSAALALATKNIHVTLLEKEDHLHETGAGIQLSPNATSQLKRWGIFDKAPPEAAVEPDGIVLKDSTSGKILLHMDVQIISRKRWKAPYITIHRADLQIALKTAIDKNPLISFKPGHEIISFEGSSASDFQVNILREKKSEKIRTPLLICCDGVWSRIRACICNEKARFSGYIAWRKTLSTEKIPASFLKNNGARKVEVWTGKTGHFIAYPLKNGQMYNFVAITRCKNPDLTYPESKNTKVLSRSFHGWHPAITDILQQEQPWTFWPLFTMPFPRFLGPSGEIFLGDASHAMTPFAAQGAAMAIEDAAALATALSTDMLSRPEALSRFSHERCKRLKAVTQRGNFNRFVYHTSGPVALARNLVMKIRPSEKFLTDLDWLYSYDASCYGETAGKI